MLISLFFHEFTISKITPFHLELQFGCLYIQTAEAVEARVEKDDALADLDARLKEEHLNILTRCKLYKN